MLKPSDFNNAVPQFSNGNYASNPINPQYVEEPSSTDYNRGTEPLQTLPAQWWNWFMNKFTSRFNKVNIYVKNLFNELAQLLSLVNVTPDGTESAVTDGQLKNAFKELYPDYINTKLSLESTYVKKTQKVNGHALSGDVTVTKSDVGLGNVPNVSTNDQTPTYTEASTLTALSSGEKLSIAFGKLAKAVSSLISHIGNTSNPHSVTKAQVGLDNVVNTGDSATPVANGTTKFTTGGAYTELGKKVNGCTIYYINNRSTIPTDKYILIFEKATPVTYYNLALHLIGEFGKISDTHKQSFDILIDFRNAQYRVVLNAVTNKEQNIFDVIATWDNNTSTARVYLEIKGGYASASINAIDGMALIDTVTTSASMLGTPSAMTFLSQSTVVQENVKDSLASNFSTSTSYSVGDYVLYNSLLYKCTTAHSAGAWNSSHFTAVTVSDAKQDKLTFDTFPILNSNNPVTSGGLFTLLTSLAPIFSTSTSYAVGDMVTYNGRLYTCTTAHSAGAWNASHFTVNDFNSFYNFTNGAKDSKTWLTKLFSRTIGNSWTNSLDVETSGTQYGVAYGKGVWVIASQRGTFWSENLTSWTPITGVGSGSNSIEFKDGIFVLGTSHTGAWWSENGKSYTLATGISGSITVSIKHVGELWFASSGNDAWWSENGKSWTTCVGTTNGISLSVLDYGDGKYFASKNNNTNLITSSDGKSWNSVTSSYFNYRVTAVKYAKGVWFVGTDRESFDKNLFTSKDGGTTWNVENLVSNSSMYVENINVTGNIALIEYYDPTHLRTTFIITFGLTEENSCIIRSTKMENFGMISLVQIYGTYFAFTFPGGLMRSTDLLIWENTFVRAESSGFNKLLFADNKLLYTSQLDGAQFSEIDLNAI